MFRVAKCIAVSARHGRTGQSALHGGQAPDPLPLLIQALPVALEALSKLALHLCGALDVFVAARVRRRRPEGCLVRYKPVGIGARREPTRAADFISRRKGSILAGMSKVKPAVIPTKKPLRPIPPVPVTPLAVIAPVKPAAIKPKQPLRPVTSKRTKRLMEL